MRGAQHCNKYALIFGCLFLKLLFLFLILQSFLALIKCFTIIIWILILLVQFYLLQVLSYLHNVTVGAPWFLCIAFRSSKQCFGLWNMNYLKQVGPTPVSYFYLKLFFIWAEKIEIETFWITKNIWFTKFLVWNFCSKRSLFTLLRPSKNPCDTRRTGIYIEYTCAWLSHAHRNINLAVMLRLT